MEVKKSPNVRCSIFRARTTLLVFQKEHLIYFLFLRICRNFSKTPFGTDHSLIVFSLELKDMILRGKGLWKFNNNLTSNAEYAEKMQNHIFETLRMLDQDNITDKELRWEFLKF